MERRFGRYGIPNLAKYLALGQLVVWVIVMFFYGDLLGLIHPQPQRPDARADLAAGHLCVCAPSHL